MFFKRYKSVWVGHSTLFYARPDVQFAMSTRKGGVSTGAFDSLNLGISTEDDPENVKQNTSLFLDALRIPANTIARPVQVHNDRIEFVTKTGTYDKTDALITNRKNVYLMVQTADCVPVTLYCPESHAIGMAHAGWRGTIHNIGLKTVIRMKEQLGANPRNMIAFIGPSIGPCCFEVGDEVREHFEDQYHVGKNVDLWKCNADQLIEAGLTSENIESSKVCTCCHQDYFYSHRGSGGVTGRMWSVVGLI